MEYQVIDNYLTKEKHKLICDGIINDDKFPWYMSKNVSHVKNLDGYYFSHLLYYGLESTSSKFGLISSILEKLNPFAIRRIKVNFYPSTQQIIKHGWHVDYDVSHKGAIYYLNSNDGKTILEDGTQIDSVANRILLFDPSIKHRSTNCTDGLCGRYNINFNFV